MDSDDSTSTSLACIPPLEPQLQGGGELAGDVVMMNPPPSPPPPVAGTKREMVGVKAFALDNVKAARVNDTANVRPLSRNMDKSQFATAPKSRRTVPLHNGGMSSTSQIAQPPAQAAFQFGVPQAAPQQFAPPGHATLTSHVLQPQYIQGHNLVPLVNQGPYGQMPAIINGFPPQNFVGMAAPPVPPVNFAQMGPNFGPAGFPPQAVANQGYAFHNIAPHNVGITPQVSTSEYNEAKLVWDRLSSSERERLVHLYAGQQASSDPSASPRVDPLPSQPPSHPNHARSVSPESEGIAMHIDNEHVTASSSKLDKGKAPQASSDVPIQEDFNGMTTDFGYMLLNKLQESHNHTENLLADFMKKQCELQAQLCNTVVRALRGAPVDSAGSESPLPLHTHRRTPQKPAKPRTAQSPATPTETGKRAGRKSNIIAPGADCPDAALTALQVAVRTHLKTLLGYTSWQDLVRRYPPLTEEEIEGYGVDSDSVPSPDVKFRVDFVHDWKRLPLNLAARDHLVQTLHGTIKGGGFGFAPDVIPLITHVHISSALDVHMEYCRRKYREHCQPDGDSDDDETKAKRKADATARKKRNAMNSRKATLLESRAYVVTNLGLSRHALLLDKLLPQNMSSDETDDPKSAHKRYRIIDAQWQSTAIKAFLRRLDGIYLEYCATRGGGGSRPRERVLAPNRKSEDSHAPEGLWRNCYDPAWLASRQAYQIRRLRIIDSDYDFSIDPAEDDVAMNSEDEVEEEL